MQKKPKNGQKMKRFGEVLAGRRWEAVRGTSLGWKTERSGSEGQVEEVDRLKKSRSFLEAAQTFWGSVDNHVRPDEQARLSAASALKDPTAGLMRLLQPSWQVTQRLDALQLNLLGGKSQVVSGPHAQINGNAHKSCSKTLMSI